MKIRKNGQLSLINPRGAGRPAIRDIGIRHTERPIITRPSSLHLTVKIKSNKANIKNKSVLRILKRAIMNARRQGLRVVHYSLEYDHVHLLVEVGNNQTLGKGMQSFGVTIAKAINRLRLVKGEVYKHRYHFRKIRSTRELKNVMSYIFNNGVKHKTSNSIVSPYNSISAEKKYYIFYKGNIALDLNLLSLLDRGKVFYGGLEYI
jgi:REP element-mobilizing transposase RayT